MHKRAVIGPFDLRPTLSVRGKREPAIEPHQPHAETGLEEKDAKGGMMKNGTLIGPREKA